MRRYAVFFAMLVSMTVVLVPMTHAADEVAGRVVYHTQSAETKEVGDTPGHVTGVLQQSGLIFFTKGPASGQVATRMATVQFDAVKGKGTYTSESVVTFQDGSTLTYKSTGTMTPGDGGKRTLFEGPYEVTGGTGKYAGTKGKGSGKGERLGTPKTGGDSYFDFAGTEWKE